MELLLLGFSIGCQEGYQEIAGGEVPERDGARSSDALKSDFGSFAPRLGRARWSLI